MQGNKFKDKYRITSTRLTGYDYAQNGLYFVTICVKDRLEFFGTVQNNQMVLSKLGYQADECWRMIPDHFPFVVLDEYIVMPNHVHGVLEINNDKSVETQNFASLQIYKNKFGPQSKNLASIIRGFKIGITRFAKDNNLIFAWQERFYDHIIRNEKSLISIRQYILNNPNKWEIDRNNLSNLFM